MLTFVFPSPYLFDFGPEFVSEFVLQTPAEGAQLVLFCALEDSVEPGGYYMDCRLYDHTLWVPKSAYDEGLAKKLWESTERIVASCGTK